MPKYLVKTGDTGIDIAKAHNITIGQLFNANPGVLWENLQPGNHINIPSSPTGKYEVVKGDTGEAIAGKVGIPWLELETLNPGVVWHRLNPGDTLKIPEAPSPLKGSVGSPIVGVPAQMLPPTESKAVNLKDTAHELTRKKVLELIGGSEDLDAALARVSALDWIGCYFLIRTAAEVSSQTLAVVDLRDPNSPHEKLAVPWKIPGSLTLPCVENKPHGPVFDNAVRAKEFASLFPDLKNGNFKDLTNVIFVDTHGHFRAPELATRYAQWILKNNTARARVPTISFMSGGLAAYCNAQSFGRILLNYTNPFVTGWPTSL